MAVRVRLKISREGRSLEVIALVNSDYEDDSPQLMIPLQIARELGLWPPPQGSIERVFETAGGPLRVWVIRGAARVKNSLWAEPLFHDSRNLFIFFHY
jgi:hypothetical protein